MKKRLLAEFFKLQKGYSFNKTMVLKNYKICCIKRRAAWKIVPIKQWLNLWPDQACGFCEQARERESPRVHAKPEAMTWLKSTAFTKDSTKNWRFARLCTRARRTWQKSKIGNKVGWSQRSMVQRFLNCGVSFVQLSWWNHKLLLPTQVVKSSQAGYSSRKTSNQTRAPLRVHVYEMNLSLPKRLVLPW